MIKVDSHILHHGKRNGTLTPTDEFVRPDLLRAKLQHPHMRLKSLAIHLPHPLKGLLRRRFVKIFPHLAPVSAKQRSAVAVVLLRRSNLPDHQIQHHVLAAADGNDRFKEALRALVNIGSADHIRHVPRFFVRAHTLRAPFAGTQLALFAKGQVGKILNTAGIRIDQRSVRQIHSNRYSRYPIEISQHSSRLGTDGKSLQSFPLSASGRPHSVCFSDSVSEC